MESRTKATTKEGHQNRPQSRSQPHQEPQREGRPGGTTAHRRLASEAEAEWNAAITSANVWAEDGSEGERPAKWRLIAGETEGGEGDTRGDGSQASRASSSTQSARGKWQRRKIAEWSEEERVQYDAFKAAGDEAGMIALYAS